MRPERWILAAACLAACAAQAADLGTLFNTPEERARLDRLRRGEVASPVEAPEKFDPSITGYVKRSDGRSTAFVDGAPVPVAPRSARLLQPSAVRAYAPRETEDLRIERERPR